MALTPERRRYTRRLFGWMALYLGTLFLAEYLIDMQGLAGAPAIAVALLPGLCITGAIWAIFRLVIETKDEFIRMLLVRQLLVATAVALVPATVRGFLETYELAPHIDSYWIAIIWFFGFGIGGFVNKRIYGTWGECM